MEAILSQLFFFAANGLAIRVYDDAGNVIETHEHAASSKSRKALLLLAMKTPPELIWRWCSGFAALCEIPFAITSIKRARALSAADFKGVTKIVFYPLFALASAVVVLQFYNLAVLNWFWPFFAGIFVHLVGAMVQFVRFVLLLPTKDER